MRTICDDEQMSVGEFIEAGLLQEINRRVLHPAGVNLEVTSLGVVRITKAPEGSGGYQFAEVSAAYAESVWAMVEANSERRMPEFYDVMQPVTITEPQTRNDSNPDPTSDEIEIPYSVGMTVEQAFISAGIASCLADAKDIFATTIFVIVRSGEVLNYITVPFTEVAIGDQIAIKLDGEQKTIRIV